MGVTVVRGAPGPAAVDVPPGLSIPEPFDGGDEEGEGVVLADDWGDARGLSFFASGA